MTRVGALSEDTLETLCLPEPSKHNVSYLCSPKTQLQRLLEQLLPFYSVVDRMLKIHLLIIGHHLQDIHYLQKDDFLWIMLTLSETLAKGEPLNKKTIYVLEGKTDD